MSCQFESAYEVSYNDFDGQQLGVYVDQQFRGKAKTSKAFVGERHSPLHVKIEATPFDSAIPAPSRFKSTSPNLPLLFSLFDVLEEKNTPSDYNNESSAVSSPVSSAGSEFSDNLSSPSYEPYSEENLFVEPLEYSQWFSIPSQYSFTGACQEKVSLLNNFADFN